MQNNQKGITNTLNFFEKRTPLIISDHVITSRLILMRPIKNHHTTYLEPYVHVNE